MRDDIEQYWRELAGMARRMPFRLIAQAAELLLDCHRAGGTVFVLGNGGSASTASHFACDLAKGTRTRTGPSFRVVPLTDNVAMLTAWANDTSYDRVFAEQLVALVRPLDVVVLISASGNSSNVVCAAEVAAQAGATTIAMTGNGGGRLCEVVDLPIRVPIGPIEQVEDVHLAIGHSLCVALRERLRADAGDAEAGTVVFDDALVQPLAIDIGR